MTASDAIQRRGFHGWKVLGTCTLSQFVAMGFTMYLIGVFIDPLAAAFDATTGQIGSVSALFVVSGAVLGPILGHWSDKGMARRILLLGASAMTLGFALLSQITDLLPGALICLFLLAPGVAMLGVIPTTVMVVHWFKKRRGLAIGITAAGISSGGFVMPPVAALLLEQIGWRGSFMALAGMIGLILLPAIWRWAIETPAEIGQYPDGATAPPEADEDEEKHGSTNIKAMLKRRDFWAISLSVGALSFCGILIITYLTPYAKESGMTLQVAAMVLSLYSISGVAGKFACGWLCDHLPVRLLLSATLIVAAVGWLPILFFDHLAAFLVSSASVGFAMGALMPVWSTLVAQNFGADNFGKVRGIMSLLLVTATVIPGPLGGYLYDSSGTHMTAFAALWWILPLGVLASLFVAAPKTAAAQA